jgi:hypothetical protein
MRNIIFALMLAAPALLGQTVKRQAGPQGQTPQQIASELMASSSLIAPDNCSSVYLAKQYTTGHNGVTHLVYRQRFQGFDVYNGAWIANIGADGRVLKTGGRLFGAPQFVDVVTQIPSLIAAQTAVHQVSPRQKHDLKPLAVSDSKAKANVVRYALEGDPDGVEGRMVWYAHRGNLVLSWMFNVLAEDGMSAYNVFVEASTGAVIAKQATTFFQAAPKGLVFDKGTPQPNLNPGTQLTSPPPLVDRVLLPLTGDPVASPQGWVINNETAGNVQLNNYGHGGTEGDAILAYTHYGAAAPLSPALNNAFFGTRDTNDGTASMIAMYIGNTGAAGFLSDGAYTALVSLHEYAHGVSLRLLPDGEEVHADGEIWVEALWDARANLIKQFGDAEGRRRIRQLVIDGLKLAPPSPSVYKMKPEGSRCFRTSRFRLP